MSALLHPLGWTLVHFLWQGTLLALAVALALWMLKGRDGRLRYAVACGGLLLMLAAPARTFQRLCSEPVIASERAEGAPLPLERSLESPASTGLNGAGWRQKVDGALPWLVFCWACGSLALSLRLAGSWMWLQWLRRRPDTHPASDGEQLLLLRLCQRMGVGSNLRLLLCRTVPGPTVLGWLRPVILIPPAMLAGLSPQALEAILAHELAHVLRHDYLVNLFQSIAEVLLFFHPAVWWVSKRIRQERERAADDLAVRNCGDALDYAQALTALEALASTAPQPSAPRLAVGARGDDFMSRIHRLISPTAPTLLAPRAGLALLLLFGLGFGLQARGPALPARTQEPTRQTPRAAYVGAKMTLDLQKVDLTSLLRIIAETAKRSLVLDNEVSGVGDFKFTDTPWDQILDDILAPRGLAWETKNGVLYIGRAGHLFATHRFTAGLFTPGVPAEDYSGAKVSLDLQKAEIADVLRQLARQGGISIRIDPDVHGRYNFKFTDVRWDQIVDVVTLNAKLRWEVRDGVLHVSAPKG